jgi:CBS-domain-containing membrane protein
MTTDLHAVEPDLGAMDALTRMQKEGIGRLLVMHNDRLGEPQDGDLVGLVTRSDVMTALSIIKQSGNLQQEGEDTVPPNPPTSEPEPERF